MEEIELLPTWRPKCKLSWISIAKILTDHVILFFEHHFLWSHSLNLIKIYQHFFFSHSLFHSLETLLTQTVFANPDNLLCWKEIWHAHNRHRELNHVWTLMPHPTLNMFFYFSKTNIGCIKLFSLRSLT